MGNIGSSVNALLGGAPNNANYQAQSAQLMNPVTDQQNQAAYQAALSGLNQQQSLAQALAAQNGLGNQANVFGQQQALANALQQQAMGQGPNPAQAQLAQNTAANTANQAALMAGQRGAGSNAGLIARQAAQQGGMNQQNMVGQAATMQAQQQLAAQQQLMAQQQAMQQVAGQQIGNQMAGVQGYNNTAQGLQGNLLNATGSTNNARVGMQGNMNSANSAMAQTNANNTAKTLGGLFNGAGQAISSLFAEGGIVENPKLAQVSQSDRMPLPDHIKGMAEIYHPHMIDVAHMALGGPVQVQQTSVDNNASAIGNSSTVDIQAPAKKEKAPAKANYAGADTGGDSNLMNASGGALVPGKAKVKGDSLKNDNVPAMLSAGEIVLPRHITTAKDAPEKAKAFVAALLEKHGGKIDPKGEEDEFRSALKKAISSRKKGA